MEGRSLLGAFGLAAAISALVTALILRRRLGAALDQPDGWRKQHHGPIPRLGGLPLFVVLCGGWLIALVLHGGLWLDYLPLMLGNAAVFAVGLLDDFRPLGAKVKLAGQIGAALLLYSMGVSVDVLSNPLGQGSLQLGFWSLPVTVLWLVAVPNVINLVDGMDGLAAGVGLLLCLTLAIVAGHNDQMQAVWLAVLMAGAICGFLGFNLPPAKIFLGDGGAYLLGFFIASLSLKSSQKGSVMAALLVVVTAMGLPILDTAFAIMRRAVRGVSIFSADADHIHHRLMLLGYSKTRALMALYGACLMLSLAGLSILLFRGMILPVALAVFCLGALGLARYLGYVRRWGSLREQWRHALARRRKLEHWRAHALALEFDIERCVDLAQFEQLLRGRLQWLGLLAVGHAPLTVLRLSDGREACFASVDDDSSQAWLQRRALDAFVDPLELALQRWNALPPCVAKPVNEAPP